MLLGLPHFCSKASLPTSRLLARKLFVQRPVRSRLADGVLLEEHQPLATVLAWRADPAQRSVQHVGYGLLRVIIAQALGVTLPSSTGISFRARKRWVEA
jgi:hypothetical protein